MSAPRIAVSGELPARVAGRIDKTNTCWMWIGRPNSVGYGQIKWQGRTRTAHRLVYELTVGALPLDLVLDHLCRTPLCVNPDHLEPVTSRENVLRGVGPSAINAKKTHCPAGHEYSPANTWTGAAGKRSCRLCHRVHQANYLARRRAAHAVLREDGES